MQVKLCVVLCGLWLACTASAANILVNGTFSTGDLAGWTISDVSSLGSFYVDGIDATTPLNGSPTAGPDGSSTYYAVSDDFGPDMIALTQSFVASVAGDYTLSFDVFVNDFYEGAGFGSSGFGGEVDLLAGGSDPIAGTPIAVFYGPADSAASDGNPNPWISVNTDITTDLTVGQTYVVRVLESDSSATINVGVDNFDLEAVAATPEPGTLLSVALASGFFVCFGCRRVAGARSNGAHRF